jgi:hypothetical protein
MSSDLNLSEIYATVECSSEPPVHAMRNELISSSPSSLKRAVPIECCSGSPVLAVSYELISSTPNSSKNAVSFECCSGSPATVLYYELVASSLDPSSKAVPIERCSKPPAPSFAMSSYPQLPIHPRELFPLSAAAHLPLSFYAMS